MTDNVTRLPEPEPAHPDPLTDVRDALGAAWLQLPLADEVTREDAARFLRCLSAAGWGLVRHADLLPDVALDALPLHGVEVIVLRADQLDVRQAQLMSIALSGRAGHSVVCIALTRGATLQALDVEQMRRAGWVRADG